MILAFTDFGFSGPYLGEMRTAALREAPSVPYVDLVADAPAFRPDLAAYLLAALVARMQPDDVVLGVVDPGVGTERAPLAVAIDDFWLVGPDNGLFELAMRRAGIVQAYRITWQPTALSTSFHGRDLFAPVAARLASGDRQGLTPTSASREPDWPDDLDRVVHVDHYGNLISGRRAQTVEETTTLRLEGHAVHHAPTFAAATMGTLFWYANSSGLVEIASNGGSAAAALGVGIDAPVEVATVGG
jgi:hypothetical protein